MFARTERLILRPGWDEEAAILAATIARPAVIRNLSRVPWPYREQDARAFLGRPHDPTLPHLLAFHRTMRGLALVGGVALGQEGGAVEIGYWVAPAYWGQGFATEMASAIIAMADAVGYEWVEARHFADNPASGGVLRKLGFRETGPGRPIDAALRDQPAATISYRRARFGMDSAPMRQSA